MVVVISTLTDAISYINYLYNSSSTPPTSSEEDYLVWTALLNVAINTWESDNGILWGELFVKLADAASGTKTVTAGTYTYSVPSDFSFPASGYVWLGSGTSKTPLKVIKQAELQLYENDKGLWCYFLMDGSPTLEINPNLTLTTDDTITYNYYKKATKLATGTDAFEMKDPMYAVYFVLAELKKEEGNTSELTMASEKLKGMEDKNEMPTWFMADQVRDKTTAGFGV